MLGDRRLGSLTPFDIRTMVEGIHSQKGSPYPAETSLRLVRSILQAAVQDGLLARSVGADVDAPKRTQGNRRYLSDDEIEALVAEVPDEWKAFALIAAYGGLRFGEICGLRVDHVNFLRRNVRVEQAIVEVRGKHHFGPPKSGAGRVVSLPTFVVESISEHVRLWPPGEDGLLFTESTGEPVWRSNFRKRVWLPALRRSGIGKLRFHDLRPHERRDRHR